MKDLHARILQLDDTSAPPLLLMESTGVRIFPLLVLKVITMNFETFLTFSLDYVPFPWILLFCHSSSAEIPNLVFWLALHYMNAVIKHDFLVALKE